MNDLTTRMRLELAMNAGIHLDPVTPRIAPPVKYPEPRPTIDRTAIHAALVRRGAPERSLGWLTTSCPSLEDANRYNPPPLAGGKP